MHFLWHHGEMDVFSSLIFQFAEDTCRKLTFLKNQVLNDLEQNKKDNNSPA